ncbi:ferredoxin 1b isoform X2 [Pristis pectinata]|uniref:ferredoxin 1b isoform X2 n=1 Tax=Pristis pectinata TaxID=685728 RepID=UPI00223DB15D|nr:ferredoxin 1b isoform X2 [Pristis pectinata]
MMGHGVFRLQSLCGLLCEGARFYSRTPVVKGFEVLQPAVNQQKRSISLSAVSRNGRSDEKLTVHFINQHNKKLTVVAEEDESLLDVVLNHNLDIEGFGSCEGTLACSTCHLIFDKENFDSLDKISVEELDMLDLAFGLTDTSRLGCQVHMKKSLDGMTVKVPKAFDVRKATNAKQQS